MIGRETSLSVLLSAWDEAKLGTGRLIMVSGEPGIGKSRLTLAVLKVIAKEQHTSLCQPHHGGSALYPIMRQLEDAAGFDRGEDISANLKKLESLLALTHTSSEEFRLLAALLSLGDAGLDLSPKQQRLRTLQALVRQVDSLLRLSRS